MSKVKSQNSREQKIREAFLHIFDDCSDLESWRVYVKSRIDKILTDRVSNESSQ